MEPETNDCCFEGSGGSPTCKSKRGFTCAHGRTLKRNDARRALGVDPLLVYRCETGHVQHLRNDAGQRTACGKCEDEAVRLMPHEARQAKIEFTFNVRRFYHLSE